MGHPQGWDAMWARSSARHASLPVRAAVTGRRRLSRASRLVAGGETVQAWTTLLFGCGDMGAGGMAVEAAAGRVGRWRMTAISAISCVATATPPGRDSRTGMSTAMINPDRTRFWIMIRRVRTAWSSTSGRWVSRSPMIAMSAASIATSLPAAPIAMPTCAVASAGMRHCHPRRRPPPRLRGELFNSPGLFGGESSARTSSMPACAARAAAVAAVVAGEHRHPHPATVERCDDLGGFRAQFVTDTDDSDRVAVDLDEDRCRATCLQSGHVSGECCCVDEPGFADPYRPAFDGAGDAVPRQPHARPSPRQTSSTPAVIARASG